MDKQKSKDIVKLAIKKLLSQAGDITFSIIIKWLLLVFWEWISKVISS